MSHNPYIMTDINPLQSPFHTPHRSPSSSPSLPASGTQPVPNANQSPFLHPPSSNKKNHKMISIPLTPLDPSTTSQWPNHTSVGRSTPCATSTAPRSKQTFLTYYYHATQGHAKSNELTATIYFYITSGFRWQHQADICGRTTDNLLFLYALIIRNQMIYVDIHPLLQMNRINSKFPELPRRTHVVIHIIKDLWTEEYDEEITKWKQNKTEYERRPNESSPLPNIQTTKPFQPPPGRSQNFRQQACSLQHHPQTYPTLPSHNSSMWSTHTIGFDRPTTPPFSSYRTRPPIPIQLTNELTTTQRTITT